MGRIEPSDEHEKGMVMHGRVQHRDKLVARGLALGMLIGFASCLAASIAIAMGWGANIHIVPKVLTFVMTPLFLFALLTRTVVRTAVTSEELAIEWGLTRRRIPLSAISKVEVLDVAQVRERAPGGYELHCPGGFTEAVWVEWSDSTSPRRALVGAADARGLMHAIEAARGKRVRVDASVVTAADERRDAQAEAEVDEAASHARSVKRG